jgi:hypothetical protein
LHLMTNVKFNIMKKYDYIVELVKKHSLTHLVIASILLAMGGILARFPSPLGDYIMATGALIMGGYTLVAILHAFIINPIRKYIKRYKDLKK